jgi:hypothetical protein
MFAHPAHILDVSAEILGESRGAEDRFGIGLFRFQRAVGIVHLRLAGAAHVANVAREGCRERDIGAGERLRVAAARARDQFFELIEIIG